jgi:hypothetical protein
MHPIAVIAYAVQNELLRYLMVVSLNPGGSVLLVGAAAALVTLRRVLRRKRTEDTRYPLALPEERRAA